MNLICGEPSLNVCWFWCCRWRRCRRRWRRWRQRRRWRRWCCHCQMMLAGYIGCCNAQLTLYHDSDTSCRAIFFSSCRCHLP